MQRIAMPIAQPKLGIPLVVSLLLLVTPIAVLSVTVWSLKQLSDSTHRPLPPTTSLVFTSRRPIQLPPTFRSISAILHLPPPLSKSLLISDVSTNTLFHIDTSFPSHAAPLLSNAGHARNDTHAFSLRRPGIAGMAIYDNSESHVRILITRQAARDVALVTLTPSDDPGSFTPNVASVVSLTKSFNGSMFNSPHSVVADKKHGVFFTDPTFGLILEDDEFDRKLDEPEGMEQEGQHLYHLSPSAIEHTVASGAPSEPKMMLGGLDRPTGIAVVGDGLFLATSSPREPELRRYDLWGDGVKEEGVVLRRWKKELHGWGQKQFTPVVVDHLTVVRGKWILAGVGDGIEAFKVGGNGEDHSDLVDSIELGIVPGPQNVAQHRVEDHLMFAATADRVMIVETQRGDDGISVEMEKPQIKVFSYQHCISQQGLLSCAPGCLRLAHYFRRGYGRADVKYEFQRV